MATVNSRTEPTGGSFGPRKTLIIMVTVVGCIAILWPKVFYPMMVGPTQTKSIIKDHRGSGCCDVVLDQEETYANMSINIPSQQNLFRKRNIGPTVEDSSIRQERPPHLRPDTIHPAMRERGRAIPHVGSVHSERPQSSPRIVEGRPGPIPGMRPPMGAGSHQSTKSANSMGFIMPLYTIGIVSFFIYTILKLIFKKTPATPYPEIKPDTTFRNEVFTTPDPYIKRPDIGTTKLGQPIANGENGAPVSVGPVSNGSASTNFSHSVQAEISVDYEQLAAKPEPRSAATDSSVEDEPIMVTAAPVEQGKSDDACSAPEETNHDEHVQPEYDPATEEVVDGIVVQKIVRLDEEGTSNEIIERVASQVVEEVLHEAESKVNEAAEAAAVELVEKVVEQAEAAAFVTDVNEAAEIEEPAVSTEEKIVLEALSEAVCEQVPAMEEEVACEASVPEMVEDVEPILLSKEVAFTEASQKPQEDNIVQEVPIVELTVSEDVTTEEVIQVSKEAIIESDTLDTDSKEVESDETPTDEVVDKIELTYIQEEIVSNVSASAASMGEDSIDDSVETPAVEEDDQNAVAPKEFVVTQEELIVEDRVPETVTMADPILDTADEVASTVKDSLEISEALSIEPTESQVVHEETTVEIAVSDEATVEEVLQALKQVTFAEEEPTEKLQEDLELSSENTTAQIEVCEKVPEATVPVVEVVVEAIGKDTPIEAESASAEKENVVAETVESTRGVSFEEEVVEIVSKVDELVEKHLEVVEEASEPAVVTSTVKVVVDNSESPDADALIDAEETTIKALAEKMEEASAQQAEEAEVREIATELVNDVLEQAESIANERAEEESFVLPSFDPATQKLVDGEVINRFAPEEVVSEVTGESSSAAEPVVEDVIEKVSVQDISSEVTEKVSIESPTEMEEAVAEVIVDGQDSEKVSLEVEEAIIPKTEEDIIHEISVRSAEIEEASPAVEESAEEVDAEEVHEVLSEPPVTVDTIITDEVEPSVEASVEVPVEASVEPSVEGPVESSVVASVEPSVEASLEASVEPSVEPTVDASVKQSLSETMHDQIIEEMDKNESLSTESTSSAVSEQIEVPEHIAKDVSTSSLASELDLQQPLEESVVAEVLLSTEVVQESVVDEPAAESDALKEASEPAEIIEDCVSAPMVNEKPVTSETSVEAAVADTVEEDATATEPALDTPLSHVAAEEVSAKVADIEAIPETDSEIQPVETEVVPVVEQSVSTNESSISEQFTVEENVDITAPVSEIQLEHLTGSVVESKVEDTIDVLESPVTVSPIHETITSVEPSVAVNETSESVPTHSVEHQVTLLETPGEIRKEEPAMESTTSVQVEEESTDVQVEMKTMEVTATVDQSVLDETDAKEAAQTSESIDAESNVAVEKEAPVVETDSMEATELTVDGTQETPLIDVTDVISVETKVIDVEPSVEAVVEESLMEEVVNVQESESNVEVKKDQETVETVNQIATELPTSDIEETRLTSDVEVEATDVVHTSEEKDEKGEVPEIKEEMLTVETKESELLETPITETNDTPSADTAETISVEEDCVQKSAEEVTKEAVIAETPEEKNTTPSAEDVVSESIITTEVQHDASSNEPVIVNYDEAEVEVVCVSEVRVEEPEESASKISDDPFTRGPTIEEIHDETVDASDEGKTSEEFTIKVDVDKVDTSEMISEVADDPTVTSSVSSATSTPVLDIISENQEDAEIAEIEKEAAETILSKQVEVSPDHYTKEKLDHVTKEALVERTLTEATAVATEIEQIVDHIITEKILHAVPSEVCSHDKAEGEAASEVVSEPEKLASSAAKVVESIISEEKVSATSSATSTVPASSSDPAEANISINQLSTSTDTNQPECPSTQSSSTTLPCSSPAVDQISSENAQEDDSIVRDAPISNLNFAVVEGIQDAAQHIASSAEHVISSSNSCTTTTIITGLTQHPEAISNSSSSSSAAIIDQVPTSVSNVTNPKFLTLNLVNYSPSGSSGNNSNSSASALTQSRNAAGTADVAAVASDSSDQLMELDLLRRKLDETELAMAKIIANMGAIPKGQSSRLFKV